MKTVRTLLMESWSGWKRLQKNIKRNGRKSRKIEMNINIIIKNNEKNKQKRNNIKI